MNEPVQFFSGFAPNDMWFMAEAAWRTLLISLVSISLGTALGAVFGWLLYEGKFWRRRLWLRCWTYFGRCR
jgi:ABC-type Fe3+ transport system permease subunit